MRLLSNADSDLPFIMGSFPADTIPPSATGVSSSTSVWLSPRLHLGVALGMGLCAVDEVALLVVDAVRHGAVSSGCHVWVMVSPGDVISCTWPVAIAATCRADWCQSWLRTSRRRGSLSSRRVAHSPQNSSVSFHPFTLFSPLL